MTGSLFCFGFGYSAEALAERLMRVGWRVAGTCRSLDKAARLEQKGVDPFLFSNEHPLDDAVAALGDATHVLISTPPDPEAGDPVLAAHRDDLAAAARDIAWLGYLSTTGVYGDRGGEWVDEASPLTPTTERGQRRLEAERAWLVFGAETGVPVHLFRLAGIYGPGRNQLASLRKGKARRIDKPGQVFSRIHVADIAAVLDASIARPNAGAAYNVCDDEPAPPQEVVAYAADLLGVEPPPLVPFESADLGPMARSFYAESKRVRNGRIKHELGVALRYPTYREGLKVLYEAGSV